jgi:hypothetical protein
MAAAWPALADVKAYLRLGSDTADDTVISEQLAAAIAWVVNRVDPGFAPGGQPPPGGLADPLFTVAVMEAGRLYRRRDSVDGTIGWGDMGLVRVGPKDPDIETLIAPYLALVFG